MFCTQGSCLADFWTQNMHVIRSSETSVRIRTTRCYIPEVNNVHNYRYENLKSCILLGRRQLVICFCITRNMVDILKTSG
jgi:hypothetical protein